MRMVPVHSMQTHRHGLIGSEESRDLDLMFHLSLDRIHSLLASFSLDTLPRQRISRSSSASAAGTAGWTPVD